MNIELHISEAAQANLRQYAAMTGKSIDDLVQETLEQRFSEDEIEPAPPIANSEWKARLRKWAASHPAQGHFVDVSRESIYRGQPE